MIGSTVELIILKTVQISANGLRDGSVGDDASSDRAKESIQVNILPQTLVSPRSWVPATD